MTIHNIKELISLHGDRDDRYLLLWTTRLLEGGNLVDLQNHCGSLDNLPEYRVLPI